MRMLVVEDEQKLAQLVKRALTAERFSVDVAHDGREGLELATTYDYDLIILDLLLPQLDGSEILRRVRHRNSYVPVLILTARDAVRTKSRTLKLVPMITLQSLSRRRNSSFA